MSNDPTRAAFERIKAIPTEIGTLRDDLAELKTEHTNGPNAMTPEAWSDVVALARLAVMDITARDKKSAAAKRREELAEQMELGL